MSLTAADRLYDLARNWQGQPLLAEHVTVERFSEGVGDLLRGVGDEIEDGYWTGLARPLRALRWRLATIPLAINAPPIDIRGAADLLVPRLRRCKDVAPGLARMAEALADELEHLWACADNPLGVAVAGAIDGARDPAILLVDGRTTSVVSDAFGGTRVVTAAELMRTSFSDVVAVGPTAWFPRRILEAPRAERLTFVRYGWIRDREPELGLLDGSQARLRQGMAEAAPRPPTARPQSDPDDLVPRFEWGAIARVARRGSADAFGEPVEAYLFLLASRQGVYLETREGARANIAEIDEEILVRQELISSLGHGRFLVVRTAGDEDYVRLYADQLLGDRAKYLRELQTRMKRRLNEEIDEFGVALVASRLKGLGSPIASENNLRRWAEPSNITTNDYADFAAICELIDETNAEGLWQAMREIRAAHIRAGNEVRQLLLAELQKADLAGLLQDGWGDYDVDEIEGEGSLRVARITGKAPDPVEVPRSRLRKAFDIEGDLWLG